MNKSITKEEIAELPIRAFEGKINVPLTEEEIIAAVDYLRKYPILGFDTETRPSFRKGQHNNVALLQLSAGDEAFLFRLNKIKLPNVVKQLLADASITKVGAAIHDDLKALVKLSPFEPAGFIDVQTIAKQLGIENLGLRPLAALLMGIKISKAQQTSNWEIPYLTAAQKLYAATDAWVSLEIYTRLNDMLQQSITAE
ncbi:MAG: 3'-5' exonuclease domain-containing protein 2 [Salinivirgaceae bacterium]|nr:3'-5' exonuclease domain-containing protein 2 [Salinivirgaceae bacterium]